jgi:hypothetical protein
MMRLDGVNAPGSISELTSLGRVRLSKNFFMREMLYSEISNFCGVPNYPHNPDLAIAAGKRFCEEILEPLKAVFGQVAVRSAYRSQRLNGHGHELLKQGDHSASCAPNDFNRARHAWDELDGSGKMGACATIVIPCFTDYYQKTGDWKAMGWWLRDELPSHDEVYFFRNLGAFNIRWYEGESLKPICLLEEFTATSSKQALLTQKGQADFEGDHGRDFAAMMRAVAAWGYQ